MARQVLTQQEILTLKSSAVDAGSRVNEEVVPASADNYADRLLKYIPGEIVALYMLVNGLANTLSESSRMEWFHWILFALFCMLTYAYLWRMAGIRKVQQLIISVVAFVVWVFALGGPFALYSWYDPLYGQILLPLYTFAIAIVEAEK
jgi:hypothetical protein